MVGKRSHTFAATGGEDFELCLCARPAARAAIEVQPSWSAAQVLVELYEHLVEARTVLPTFYRDFPVEVSPLTRQHRDDPRLAEKWDLVAFGAEIGTGYSELVDPVEQRARLTAQSLLAAGGDAEAMQLDEDFLRALEYGMPPSGGTRLVHAGPLALTLLTDRTGPAIVALSPDDILVSAEPLHSSARNTFAGRVRRISEDGRGGERLNRLLMLGARPKRLNPVGKVIGQFREQRNSRGVERVRTGGIERQSPQPLPVHT